MDGLLANKVEITRAGELIGIQLEVEVSCDDLKRLAPGEPLLVIGALDSGSADRVRTALGRALADASDMATGGMSAKVVPLPRSGGGNDPAGGSAR